MANQNEELLKEFVAYCEAHPNQRFWQALRNWSGQPFIMASPSVLYLDGKIRDTFYWTGKDK